jgi:hypothetical protein
VYNDLIETKMNIIYLRSRKRERERKKERADYIKRGRKKKKHG